jgi:phytoene/squalene synthetase
VDPQQFNGHSKELIEREIEAELEDALEGIKRLPASSRGGVYLAFVYYRALFNKIKRVPAHRVLSERIRISNGRKFGLMLNSMLQYKFNML